MNISIVWPKPMRKIMTIESQKRKKIHRELSFQEERTRRESLYRGNDDDDFTGASNIIFVTFSSMPKISCKILCVLRHTTHSSVYSLARRAVRNRECSHFACFRAIAHYFGSFFIADHCECPYVHRFHYIFILLCGYTSTDKPMLRTHIHDFLLLDDLKIRSE